MTKLTGKELEAAFRANYPDFRLDSKLIFLAASVFNVTYQGLLEASPSIAPGVEGQKTSAPAMPRDRPVEPIYGATSEETAYLVEDYPYGFRKRTSIRYWVERNKKGYRFVSQTLDPKRNRWNAPKASTYTQGPLFMYVNKETGHVNHRNYSGGAGQIDTLIRDFYDMPRTHLSEILASLSATRDFYKREVELLKKGITGMTINGEPVAPRPGDLERAEGHVRETEESIAKMRGLIPSGTFRNPRRSGFGYGG